MAIGRYKKTILKIFIIMVILPVSVLGSLFYLNKIGFFNLSDLEIQINTNEHAQYYTPLSEELKNELKKFEGKSLFELKMKDLSKVIQQKEWVDTHSISRVWPNSILINVHAQSIALVYVEGAQFYPITTKTKVLKSVSSELAPDVPITTDSKIVRLPNKLQQTIQTIESLPQDGSFSKNKISEIGYDKKEGYWVTLVHNNLKVKLGEENIQLKSSRVSQVIDYVESKQFKARVIDANLSKKVLVKLRND